MKNSDRPATPSREEEVGIKWVGHVDGGGREGSGGWTVGDGQGSAGEVGNGVNKGNAFNGHAAGQCREMKWGAVGWWSAKN